MELGLDKIKESADKLFLLGLFALGLVIAQMLVSFSKRLVLSDAIDLDVDISVRVPQGQGWEVVVSRTRNPVAYSSRKIGGMPVIDVYCKLIPLSSDAGIPEQLAKVTEKYRLDLYDGGHLNRGKLFINWIHGTTADRKKNICLGVVQIPEERAVIIEVKAGSDPEFARRIFETVLRNVKYRLQMKMNDKNFSSADLKKIKKERIPRCPNMIA